VSRKREKIKTRRLRIAVMISGGGTTLQNLIDRTRDGRMPGVEIVVVIASRGDIKGVQRAAAAGLPVDVIAVKDFPDVEKFSEHIVLTLDGSRWACRCRSMFMPMKPES
jgi:folate-dependent phosphoribosylglycinamide formyltransferase PurN